MGMGLKDAIETSIVESIIDGPKTALKTAYFNSVAALMNDFKAQWNVVNPTHTITAKDIVPLV